MAKNEWRIEQKNGRFRVLKNNVFQMSFPQDWMAQTYVCKHAVDGDYLARD